MSTYTYNVNDVVKEDDPKIASAPKKDSAIPYTPSKNRKPEHVSGEMNDYLEANHKRSNDVTDNVDGSIPKDTSTEPASEIMDTSIPKETVTETITKPMDTSIPEEPISDEETTDNTCDETQFSYGIDALSSQGSCT